MALERPTLQLNSMETRPTFTELPLVSQRVLEELKVPKEIQEAILRDPNAYNRFFAGQGTRLTLLEYREEVKSPYAALGEPTPDSLKPVVPGALLAAQSELVPQVTDEEQKALQGWVKEKMAGLVSAQAKDPEAEKLIKELKGLADQLAQDQPDLFVDPPADPGQSGTPDAPTNNGGSKAQPDNTEAGASQAVLDIINDTMKGQLKFDSEEDEKKYEELLLMLASRGDSDGMMLAIADKATYIYGQKAQKIMKSLQVFGDVQDKANAQFDLLNKGGKASTADIAKFNAETAKAMTNKNMAMEQLRGLLNKVELAQSQMHESLKSQDQAEHTMLTNLRT